MDVSAFLTPQIAPRVVFARAMDPELACRPRFWVPKPGSAPLAVSWREFSDQIRAVAAFLVVDGLRMGERCAVFAPNRVEWASAALGIQAAGGVMVPIHPSSTAEQAAQILRDSQSRVLFVDTIPLLERVFHIWGQLSHLERIVLLGDTVSPHELTDQVALDAGASIEHRSIDEALLTWSGATTVGRATLMVRPGLVEAQMEAIPIDSPGLMLFTSGTSGAPKGVPLTHRNLSANGADWLTALAPLLEEHATDLLWRPFSDILGFSELCLGNTLGWTSHLSSPARVMADLPRVAPRVFMSAPWVWKQLAATAKDAAKDAATVAERRARLDAVTGGNLGFCLSAGVGLAAGVKELLHECGLLIIEGYGLTEASPMLTMNRPDAFRFDSVGKPLPSVELRLAADGEILARGPSIFGGYHNRPQETVEVLDAEGWLHTGDLGRLTNDGFLQIVGRKQELLVTAGGQHVSPAKIEALFRDDTLIEHVVVFGDGHPHLVAGVWPRAGHRLDVPQLRDAIQARIDTANATLAAHEVIKTWAVMDEPLSIQDETLTATQKLRRQHIYEVFGDALEALYE